jgi:hypothetical protein
MKMAFAGSFAVRLAEPVQARLSLATLIAANIERTAGTKALLSAIDPHC